MIKNILNSFNFWNYFRKNLQLVYIFNKISNFGIDKIVRLRVYENGKLLHNIILSSKDECRAEFLARLDGETPLQIWTTWRQPKASELIAGTQIWYFYGGWKIKDNSEYSPYTITEQDVQILKSDPNHISCYWARVPNRVMSAK